MRVLTCLLIFLSFSCSDSDSTSNLDCIPIEIDKQKFESAQNYSANVIDFTLNGNCLNVKLGIPGCDIDNTIEMVSIGSVNEALPPRITFDFYKPDGPVCQSFYSSVDREYDLSPLNELYDLDSIIIFLQNTDRSLIFYK